MTRRAGDRLGPHELVRELGRGGMGEVWEAVLHGPGGFRKPVAVKLLRASGGVGGDLLREARLGAMLHHPNVVGTHGIAQYDGTWCLTLELVRGGSLSDLLRGGPLPGRAVVEVGVQVAAALAHVHELAVDGRPMGLVHRDVKPANLLLDPTGLVKLVDLGISSWRADPRSGPIGAEATAETAAECAGTPGYMAPEQAEGFPEARSDLFALGVTLYVLATGVRPFGVGAAAIAAVRSADARVRADAFLRPVEAAAPGLGAVLVDCLRSRPGERPASARELGERLGALRGRQAPGPTLVELHARARPGPAGVGATPSSDAPTRIHPTGNLRPPRDRFVGRAEDLARLEAAVRGGDGGLRVLVGPGGFGKTRLALEVARRMQRAVAGGTWAFDLTEARSPAGICGAVAAALGLPLDRADPVGQLGRALAGKGRAVFVLDNLEGCLPHLADTLGRWVDGAPDALFLGTSRIAPGLRGEVVVPLDELAPDDALALFESRAPRPLDPADRTRARELCAALDHVPLAIELCAARLRVLGLADLRERLGLALLSGGGAELPERHRSLAASLDWSRRLLGPAAQDALGQLSVFEGGFTLEAAEAVLDLEAHGAWALDVLQELVDASLLRVDARTRRFGMLSVVREYAARRHGAEAVARAARRHLHHFAAWGDDGALAVLRGPGAVAGARRYALELPNALAACGRAVELGDGERAVATLLAAWATLYDRGPCSQARAYVDRILWMPTLSDRARGRAEELAGRVAYEMGELEAARAHLVAAIPLQGVESARATMFLGAVELGLAEVGPAERRLREVVAKAEATGDRRLLANALVHLAGLVGQRGRTAEREQLADRALTLAHELGDVRIEIAAELSLGRVYRETGRMDLAREIGHAALRRARELGDLRDEGIALTNLASSDYEQGRNEEALARYRECLALARETADLRGETIALGNVGMVLADLGRLGEAEEAQERALALHERSGDRRLWAISLSNLSDLVVMRGDVERARAGYETALAVAREIGERRFEAHVLTALGDASRMLGRPREAQAALQQAIELHRAVGNPRGEALAMSALALVHVARGLPGPARVCAEEALEIATETQDRANQGLGRLSAARACLAARDPAAARELLGPAAELLQGPWHLGFVWCAHAEIARGLGDADGRTRAVAEAERCLAASGAGPGSELANLVAAARA